MPRQKPQPAEDQFRDVTLPHAFDQEMPQSNVCGLYSCNLTVPEELQGLDLILDLGLVDDADVTYFNGEEIGRGGDFADKNKSWWNRDRVYWVPSRLVRYGRPNQIQVLVKDFEGIGGLLGSPYLGGSLIAGSKCLFAGTEGLHGKPGGPPARDSKDWKSIRLPDFEWNTRFPNAVIPRTLYETMNYHGIPVTQERYGWYRFELRIPGSLQGNKLLLDLGRIYDVGVAYLNGKVIGKAGELPPDDFLQTGARFRCEIPAEDLVGIMTSEEKPVLDVLVWNRCGFGGLLGEPSIPITDWRRKSPQEKDCEKIYQTWMSGERDTAWEAFRKLDFTRPVTYDAATAAAKACSAKYRPTASPVNNVEAERTAVAEELFKRGVLYLGQDRYTRGDWEYRYGRELGVICGMCAPFDATYGLAEGFTYQPGTGQKGQNAMAWVSVRDTPDPRALWYPGAGPGKRSVSWWDDRGETHPFDDAGPDLVVTVSVPAGDWLLSLYLLDLDWWATQHPRIHNIIVFDKTGGPILAIHTGKFGDGLYEQFLASGPRQLILRIMKHRSVGAVLSGLFLDKVSPLKPPPLQTGGALPPESLALAEKLKTQSEKSILGAVLDTDYGNLLGTLGTTSGEMSAVQCWWSAELLRLTGRYQESQPMLKKYFEELNRTIDKGFATSEPENLVKFLESNGYRNELIVEAIRILGVGSRPRLRNDITRGSLRRVLGNYSVITFR